MKRTLEHFRSSHPSRISLGNLSRCGFAILLLMQVHSVVSADDSVKVIASRYLVREDASTFENRDRLGEHDQLRRELAEVREEYSDWGLKRTMQTYSAIESDNIEKTVAETDWSALTPVQVFDDLLLRSGERFLAERLSPVARKMVFAHDGRLARVRGMQQMHNGPLREMMFGYEENFAPQLPHTVIVDLLFAPDTEWLYGTRGKLRLFPMAEIFGRPTITEQTWDGHPCWKVNWKSTFNDEIDSLIHCEAWLARDRSLLPILQTYRSGSHGSVRETRRIEIEAFQKDPANGLWFPHRATASSSFRSDVEVIKIDYQLSGQYEKAEAYSDAKPILKQQKNPPAVKVAPFEPAPVLDRFSNSQGKWSVAMNAAPTELAGSNAIAFLFLIAGLSYAISRTRLGRLMRDFLRRHRKPLRISGVLLTVVVAIVCSYPPGWFTYGLAMMIAGIFGCGWLLLCMLLLGEKQVSLRMTFFAAACAAVAFAGYTQGVKRMKVREEMIADVRDQGGHVLMGNWRIDEDGLYLPASLQNVLGEAWTGRANRAAVPQEIFTAENLENWCLDEVQWLGIASEEGASFTVDADALSKLKDTRSLWTLHIEGGYLDAEGMQELTRFKRLIDLYFDCQQQPVATEITQIRDLERVWLTNAIVDDRLISTLNGIEHLEFVTLIQPNFVRCDASRLNAELQGIEIQYADVTPVALETLGQIPTKLLFADCTMQLNGTSPVSMPNTKGLLFKGSDVNNRTLVKLVDTPNIRWIDLHDTDVSVDGLEAYSKINPHVMVSIR